MSESLPSSDEPNIPLKASKFSADILYNILRFSGTKTDDLTWLWTTCREVSHDLKDAADRVFITRHLKRTSLFMDGGKILFILILLLSYDASLPHRHDVRQGHRQDLSPI